MKQQSFTVFYVEPFGHELPSGLSLRVEDKSEWLRRNEAFSALKILFVLQKIKPIYNPS